MGALRDAKVVRAEGGKTPALSIKTLREICAVRHRTGEDRRRPPRVERWARLVSMPDGRGPTQRFSESFARAAGLTAG